MLGHGVGKTAFALKIAYNIANKGIKVAIISLEMSKIQLVQRLIAKEARVDSNKIRTGTLTEEEMEKVSEATARIFELPIFINTKARNIQEIEQDADNVIFLYNKEDGDEQQNQNVEDIVIDLQKQRAGPLVKVVVRFDKRYNEFTNLVRR